MKYFLNKSLLFFLIFLAVIDHLIQSLPTKSKKKKYQNGITQCVTQYTKWNISGWKDNELKYFDRHPVRCPKNHLLKEVTRMRFKYTCCKVKVYSCEWFKTNFVKSVNAYKLAKIKPNCKCNKVLKEFMFVTKFQQPGYKNPKTHVKYRCCSFHYKKLKTFKINKLSTQWNDSGKGRTKFLVRHNIRCPYSSFISSFRLALQDKNTKTNPSTRFNYSCVNPEFKARKKTNRNNRFSLEKIQVINSNKKAIKSKLLNPSSHLNDSGPSQISNSSGGNIMSLNSQPGNSNHVINNARIETRMPSSKISNPRQTNTNGTGSNIKFSGINEKGSNKLRVDSKGGEINSPDLSK